MRLLAFTIDHQPRIGALTDAGVIDLSLVAAAAPTDGRLLSTGPGPGTLEHPLGATAAAAAARTAADDGDAAPGLGGESRACAGPHALPREVARWIAERAHTALLRQART